MNLAESVEKNQGEDSDEQQHAGRDCVWFHRKGEAGFAAHQVYQQQLCQLGKENAEKQPSQQGNGADCGAFPKQDARQVPFAHSQNVVEPEFRFSSADQERVGVKQKNKGENGDDPGTEAQNSL